ncbi:MarR family winged helix-turn-helix transcriptional regulator [Altericroceibacterium endophyticum]|uniref:MarR family transcriptional regulator n=1 Tax=Altericroceibacterium endophyticum TaxID=1808508 RepID=A0A6I4T8R2_9SPHN|nr:MarR family transcriptional regulator [Altericroceibacterium endophyticum]MXO66145.1 MarR family transcriptional regulator [Altericroceibacterium endophyticum]
MSQHDNQDDARFDNWAVNFNDYYHQGSRVEAEFLFSRNLIIAARRWTSYIDEAIRAKTGHSRAHWQTLFGIAFAETPVTTLDLSERMGVQWPSLVRTLNELESKALIRRWKNPEDRRSRLVEITDNGREALADVKEVLDPKRHELFADFEEDELRVATELMERLYKKMER